MSLKMRDMPRLTASILFSRNKYYKAAEEAVKIVAQWRFNSALLNNSALATPLDLNALGAAVDDLADPRNNHTICKVLLPKMNAKLRKLQIEGMFIVGVMYEEANVQTPADQVVEDPFNRYGEFDPPTEDKPPVEVVEEEIVGDPYSRYDPTQE